MFRRLLKLLPTETIEGYEHPELVDVIFNKTVAFRPDEPWREIEGAGTVLDFGGGCGLHYKQAQSPDARWAVVETAAMVARAMELQTEHLRFFTSTAEAAGWLGDVDLLHSNGALQYTAEPLAMLRELCALRAKRIVWDRVALSSSSLREVQTSFLDDNGPGRSNAARKLVRYERHFIPESAFLDAHADYQLTGRGPDWFRYSLR